MPFFTSLGFQLPERKGIADFLQEVTSSKDQHKYWAPLAPADPPAPPPGAGWSPAAADPDLSGSVACTGTSIDGLMPSEPGAASVARAGSLAWTGGDGSGGGGGSGRRDFFTVPQFVAAFAGTAPAKRLQQQLDMPFDRASCPRASLVGSFSAARLPSARVSSPGNFPSSHTTTARSLRPLQLGCHASFNGRTHRVRMPYIETGHSCVLQLSRLGGIGWARCLDAMQ